MSPPEMPEEEPEREELHPNFKAAAAQAAAASAAAYERYNAAAQEPEPEPEPQTGSIAPPGTPEPKPRQAAEQPRRGGGVLGKVRRRLGR